jgi:flagellar biosynthesis protein FlhF
MTMTMPAAAGEQSSDTADAVRVYRGRSLAELLPQIRAALGADAVVVRQREGRAGGIGGFFAQRFVEIEAMAGTPRIDIYDDPEDADGFAQPRFERWGVYGAAPDPAAAPAIPAQTPVELRAPEVEPTVARPQVTFADTSASFADHLAAAEAPPPPLPLSLPLAAMPACDDVATAEHVADALVSRGFSLALTERLIAAARTHRLPLSPAGDLRRAVRDELAHSLPVFGGLPVNGAGIAVVGTGGTGKTRVAAALAAAHQASGSLAVRTVVLGDAAPVSALAGLLAPTGIPVAGDQRGGERSDREGALLVIDTAAVAPADHAAIASLAARLDAYAPDAVLLAVPAGTATAAISQIITALAPLRPSALVLTHAEETDQLGPAIEASIESGTPIAFIHEGLDLPAALRLANPAQIAELILP